MRNPWLLIGAVALCAALVWIVLGWNPPKETGDTDVAPAEPEAPPSTPTPPPATAAPAPSEQPTAPSEPAPATPAQAADPASAQAPAEEVQETIPAPTLIGPVDELKKSFENEPRASGSRALEASIEATFRRPEVPAGLLKSVLCRTTVCRIETRWSPERGQGFLSAAMNLVANPGGEPTPFDPNLGISPEGEPDADGTRAIDVYLKRSAPPNAANTPAQ